MIVEEKEFQCMASGGVFGECDKDGCSKCKWSSNNTIYAGKESEVKNG